MKLLSRLLRKLKCRAKPHPSCFEEVNSKLYRSALLYHPLAYCYNRMCSAICIWVFFTLARPHPVHGYDGINGIAGNGLPVAV